MAEQIAILGSYDTKSEELNYLEDRIRAFGAKVCSIDTSLGGEAATAVDVTALEVAAAAGADIREMRRSTDTQSLTNTMIQGASKVVQNLHDVGRLAGIVSVGGASNTGLATRVMAALPFGVPKVMVSSMAAVPAYAGMYFGTKDIAILHSVVDIAGLNPLLRSILDRAAGMVCGMARAASGAVDLAGNGRARPRVAITEFKFSEVCCRHAARLMTEAGVEIVPFHAQGIGDRALEELIGEGRIDGVLDVVPAGVAEELLGGNRAAGPDRLEAAARQGIPQVVTPCGFDMLSCGPLERGDREDPLWVSRGLSKRKLFIPDALRVQARTTPEELLAVAEIVAGKLNGSRTATTMLIPSRGWSSLSEAGRPLCDFEADAVFIERLQARLHDHVTLRVVDMALNTEQFARLAVDELLGLMRSAPPQQRAASQGRAPAEH